MAEEKKVGFVAMTSSKKAVGKIPELGIGMIGHAFMGKAHSNGWKQMPYIFWPPAAIPKLVKICGIPEDEVAEAARRFGYMEYTTNWKEIINDDRIACIASNRDILKATDHVKTDMGRFLVEYYGFSSVDAATLIAFYGNLHFCQIVNPQKTVRMEIEKRYMNFFEHKTLHF